MEFHAKGLVSIEVVVIGKIIAPPKMSWSNPSSLWTCYITWQKEFCKIKIKDIETWRLFWIITLSPTLLQGSYKLEEEDKIVNLKSNTEVYEMYEGFDPLLLALRMEEGTSVRPSEDSKKTDFILFFFFNWTIVDLQYCVSFCLWQSEVITHIHV